MIGKSLRGFQSGGVSELFKRHNIDKHLSKSMKKTTQYLLLAACALGVVAWSSAVAAGPAAPASSMPSDCSGLDLTAVANTNTNGIPDRLKTCPVSGEKLNGDMGAPYVFSYQGQEIKLCCKGCKKDFDKNPAKYVKLIRAADKP
jgi:YHS domain-containing protein